MVLAVPRRTPSRSIAASLFIGGAALLVGAVSMPAHASDVTGAALAAMTRADCKLCHSVPGVAAAPRTDSCPACHQWVVSVSRDDAKRAKAMEVFPLWERYEKNTKSYMVVPSLEAGAKRLDPEWVRTFLRDPHDIRPKLPESMPVFELTPAEVDAIVAWFAGQLIEVPAKPAPDPARIAKGKEVFSTRICNVCHTFGAENPLASTPFAPDLAHTRDRMSPDHVYAWIENPQAFHPTTQMPVQVMPEEEILAVRDYILLAELPWTDPPPVKAAPRATTAPVTYAQVEERVFGKICVHCHMDPAQNQGRAGPGNNGGFGWPATGIELQTYEGIAAVADKIPDALLRRRDEARRDAVQPGQRPADLTRPEKPGMPMGYPPIPDEDISLVLGWIEQGMPR